MLDLEQTKIMGILNYTPDSFSDGGQFNDPNSALSHIEKMLNEGADMIDIGAISSRPGASLLDTQKEKERLKPILKEVAQHFPDTIFSLDTFRSEIARWAVETYGIDIINDIAAGELDDKMFSTIADLQVPYIIMHMKGVPETMQKSVSYRDIVQEIILYLAGKTTQLKQLGVHDVIIDPGFGFGKTLEHNYELLNRLDDFKIFQEPLLVGVSRKSMIQKLLQTTPEESLNGTTVVHTLAVQKGAKILRVHDVKEAKQVVEIINKTQNC